MKLIVHNDRTLVLDYRADVFAGYPEEHIGKMLYGAITEDEKAYGMAVTHHLYILWRDGMTYGVANMMREYGGRTI